MKEVTFNKKDNSAHTGLHEGINILADAVGSTMGPMGRNVIIDQEHDYPIMTKDGVSVAKAIFDSDHVSNVGQRIIKEVAEKTETEAGDGTTTATILARKIYSLGLVDIDDGVDPVGMNRGIQMQLKHMVKELKAMSVPADTQEMIKNVATISANNNTEIGNLIADAHLRVGTNGVVTVEDSAGFNTKVSVVNGMQFDRGYVSPYFVNRPKDICELDNPYVLIYDGKINVISPFTDILEKVKAGGASLLIIAKEVAGTALSTLVTNKIGGVLEVCAINAPAFGNWSSELLQDIATATGATVIKNVNNIKTSDLGKADAVSVTRNGTTIVGGWTTDSEIELRIEALMALRDTFDKESVEYAKYNTRIAKLDGGVGVVYVGGASELEKKERKDRVIDANHAVMSAKQEGVIPGGGLALFNTTLMDSSNLSKSESIGAMLLSECSTEPADQILRNAGYSTDEIEDIMQKFDDKNGFNCLTGEIVNMMDAGIIDPLKVTRCALENAASVAGMLLTTSAVITDV